MCKCGDGPSLMTLKSILFNRCPFTFLKLSSPKMYSFQSSIFLSRSYIHFPSPTWSPTTGHAIPSTNSSSRNRQSRLTYFSKNARKFLTLLLQLDERPQVCKASVGSSHQGMTSCVTSMMRCNPSVRTILKIMEDLDSLEERRRSEERDSKQFEKNMKRKEKKRGEKKRGENW